MNVRRGSAIVFGLAGAAAASALLVAPGAATAVPVETVVSRLGADYLLVVPFGIAALAVSVFVLGSRFRNGVAETVPVPVERRLQYRPGERIDAVLGALSWARTTESHARLHGEIRELAIATLVRQHGCSRSVAERHLEQGTWTDDHLAQQFLSSAELGPHPLSGRLRERFAGHHWYRRRVRAATAAIDDVRGGDHR